MSKVTQHNGENGTSDGGGYDDYHPPAYQPPLDEPTEPDDDSDGADHAHPFKVV